MTMFNGGSRLEVTKPINPSFELGGTASTPNAISRTAATVPTCPIAETSTPSTGEFLRRHLCFCLPRRVLEMMVVDAEADSPGPPHCIMGSTLCDRAIHWSPPYVVASYHRGNTDPEVVQLGASTVVPALHTIRNPS